MNSEKILDLIKDLRKENKYSQETIDDLEYLVKVYQLFKKSVENANWSYMELPCKINMTWSDRVWYDMFFKIMLYDWSHITKIH